MMKSRILLLTILAVVLWCSSAHAYTGPLDSVAGAKNYWGLNAATSALRGATLANICYPDLGHCADVNADATTGLMPTSITVNSHNCSDGACVVNILYDKGSEGNNLVSANLGIAPLLITNA